MTNAVATPVSPGLSIQPLNFRPKDPGVGGWTALDEQVRGADRAGIDRVVVSDHVVFGENLEAYGDPRVGGIEGGQQPTGPDGHWLDPLIVLATWAGMTKRVRLMTGVLLAGLRRPATLAKAVATLDVLSHGRVDLGVGVGWQREEYLANGLPFEGRGAHLDRTLAVCQTLWREGVASFSDGDLDFEGIHCQPKPLQPGGVPIWIGGSLNPGVLRRIVRYGSGWIPWGRDMRDAAGGLARVHEALEAAGRSTDDFEMTNHLPVRKDDAGAIDVDRTMDAAPALAEAGATDIRITVRLPDEARAVEDLLAPLCEAFRRAVGRTD